MPDRYRPRVPRYAARHEIRGVTYHVNLWGDREAPLLVLLHGWGDAGSTFQFVVDALQRHWFAVAPDWRGFGKSRTSCWPSTARTSPPGWSATAWGRTSSPCTAA